MADWYRAAPNCAVWEAEFGGGWAAVVWPAGDSTSGKGWRWALWDGERTDIVGEGAARGLATAQAAAETACARGIGT